MRISIPEFCLTMLIGPSGSGKSSLAARVFPKNSIVSSDACRAMVGDDPLDQSANAEAWTVLAAIVRARLARRKLVVVDATNLRAEDRAPLVALAREYHAGVVAINLRVPDDELRRRAEIRGMPVGAVMRQTAMAKRLRGLDREGIRTKHELDQKGIDEIEIVLERLRCDLSERTGPFDVIGDPHGCHDELLELIEALGGTVEKAIDSDGTEFTRIHPASGRCLVFVGDLVDRGPKAGDVARTVRDAVLRGEALLVPGNHDLKFVKRLRGKACPVEGSKATDASVASWSDAFAKEMADFIDQLPVHLVLDQGKLVVAHAGLPKTMHGRVGGAVRGFALNGDADGTVDATGRKRRLDWALDYDGEAAVAYGHAPETDGTWRNKTICIDRGCVFGGSLAALRWPERSVVAVPSGTRFDKELDEAFPIAKDDGKRKESKTTKEIAEEREDDEESVIPNALALLSGGSFQTRLAGRIKIERERAAAAFETISRFSVDPRLLAYIPPTIPPVKASRRPDLLEHPDEAMEQYAAKGVETIILEKKHMGSRCLLLIGKNDEAIRRDFGILRPGSIQTRSGRPFLQSAEEERIVIERLRRAMERSGLWNELDADWILLDAEALPWSAKADGLVKDVFAPLGVAAGIELATLEAKLSELRARGIDDEGMLEKARKRLADIRAYDVVWKSHRARIERPSDIAIAPFHVLAHRGKTLETVSHERHLELAGRLADVEEKIIRTEARLVTLSDPASRADGVRFWEEIVEAGGEGIVAKPNEFTASKNGKIIQPALKVRGADYLRIVYGPHYLEPERLAEIKRRDLSRKSTLAIREFALGIEGLKRFVEGDGIRAANAYAFAALALDSEPIDSRL